MGGSGLIGLLTAAVLEGMGVTTIVSELAQARKERAISSGVADDPLDPSQEDVPARVLELTGGKGADVALARCRCLLGGDGVGAQGHMVMMPGAVTGISKAAAGHLSQRALHLASLVSVDPTCSGR